jgi:hypothetical protein
MRWSGATASASELRPSLILFAPHVCRSVLKCGMVGDFGDGIPGARGNRRNARASHRRALHPSLRRIRAHGQAMLPCAGTLTKFKLGNDGALHVHRSAALRPDTVLGVSALFNLLDTSAAPKIGVQVDHSP